MVMVLLLLSPTVMHVFITANPDSSYELLIENPIEEEREEERSSAEEEMKEVKEYTLPCQLAHRDDFGSLAARMHTYELGSYTSDLPIPYLPPEPAA